MELSFKEIKDDQTWDSYVFQLPEYSFLNSSARYEYNIKIGVEAFRYAIFEEDKFKGIITGNIGISKIFGRFLEFKHSPLFVNFEEEEWTQVINFATKYAIDKKCFMFRFSPLVTEEPELERILMKHHFIKAPIHNVDALISQQIDLTKDLGELKKDMSKTRRNLLNRLLENKDVTVKINKDRSAFEPFEKFHNETVKYKGYVDKPTKLLMQELEIQQEKGMCYMVTAYYKGEPFSIWQNTVYGKNMHLYQAGASTDFRLKNLIATPLLYWRSLELGQNLGLEKYDLFGGVVPDSYENKKHPWRGVSEFKRSLGGKKITYIHSRDYPINKVKYVVYYIYSTIRTRLKGHTINW